MILISQVINKQMSRRIFCMIFLYGYLYDIGAHPTI